MGSPFSQLTIEEQANYLRPYIEVYRYRYQRDPLNGRRPSYTEYELWVDDGGAYIKYMSVRSGERFNSAKQFRKFCEQKLHLDKCEIEIMKPQYFNLGFRAQRI